MKQFGKLLLVALGFGLLAVALSFIPNHPAAAAPGGPSVTVVNTASNPVPVSYPTTPTVNVGTLPSVTVDSLPSITGSVSISGTPNVNINGTPTVSLASGAVVTLPTHLGIQPSAMVALNCTAFTGTQCTSLNQISPAGIQSTTAFTIPTGMDLVITDAAWSASSGTPGHTATFKIETVPGGGGGTGHPDFHTSTALINADGMAGATENFTTGFRSATLDLRFLVAPVPQTLELRGYLIPHQ